MRDCALGVGAPCATCCGADSLFAHPVRFFLMEMVVAANAVVMLTVLVYKRLRTVRRAARAPLSTLAV